jgi:hypothetical protein
MTEREKLIRQIKKQAEAMDLELQVRLEQMLLETIQTIAVYLDAISQGDGRSLRTMGPLDGITLIGLNWPGRKVQLAQCWHAHLDGCHMEPELSCTYHIICSVAQISYQAMPWSTYVSSFRSSIPSIPPDRLLPGDQDHIRQPYQDYSQHIIARTTAEQTFTADGKITVTPNAGDGVLQGYHRSLERVEQALSIAETAAGVGVLVAGVGKAIEDNVRSAAAPKQWINGLPRSSGLRGWSYCRDQARQGPSGLVWDDQTSGWRAPE